MSLDLAQRMWREVKDTNGSYAIWLLENFTKEELEEIYGYTWEDSFDGFGCFIGDESIIKRFQYGKTSRGKCVFRNEFQAESALAFAQLTHIVAKHNEGKFKATFGFTVCAKKDGRITVVKLYNTLTNLEFYDLKDAEISLKKNADLWKQYWMIKQ